MAKVNGNGNKIGPAIILKVMAGDKFNLRVSSWWKSEETPGTPQNPLNNLVSAMNSSIGTVSGTHGTVSELASTNVLNPGGLQFSEQPKRIYGQQAQGFCQLDTV